MGADFSSRWFFAGDTDTVATRATVVECLRHALNHTGFQEVENEESADRSLVVGPAGRWVFIGDSAGSTMTANVEAFEALSREFSTLGSVVEIHMSDSATVHFYLYKHGHCVDRFGNAAFPFYRFKTEQEAAPYRGRPELWSGLLLSADTVAALQAVWVQDWRASEILAETGELMGWEPELLWVGYTFDDEGIPTKYDEFLYGSGVALDAFNEYHFKRSA